LARYPHELAPSDIANVAARLHGYVGADIASLCREAALCAWRRQCASAPQSAAPPTDAAEAGLSQAFAALKLEGSDSTTLLQAPVPAPAPNLTLADITAGARRVQPSALREVHVEAPSVSWADIGGQEDAKARLREAVEWPLAHPEAFVRMGIRPPKGVLLYGPPGCSKTMMARAMATEGRMNFVAVKGPELFSKYVGDSEKAVADVFSKARAAAPCIVFFDEFDALAPQRGGGGADEGGGGGSSVGTRVVSQLLQELDGVTALRQVVVVAATNRPDLIDRALLRPGRIDRALFVGPPDTAARGRIVDLQLERVPHEAALQPGAAGGARAELARLLEGFSGAEIVGVFREAALRCAREAAAAGLDAELRADHVRAAAAATPRAITPDMLAFYQRFAGGVGR
jgi:AAA family ATPase